MALTGIELRLLFRALPLQNQKLGALLADLVDEEFALHGDEICRRVRRRLEIFERVAGLQFRLQSRNIQLGGGEIALGVSKVRIVQGLIELNQNLAGLDLLTILDIDRAHHAGLERLNNLGAAVSG